MDWRTAWWYVTSSHPPFQYPPEWVGSLTFYALVFLAATFLRKLNDTLLKSHNQRDTASDFIATFQTCAFSLENMHVLAHYGYWGLALVLFGQICLFLHTYGTAQASPTGNFLKWWLQQLSHRDAILRISLQALAAYVSYKCALVIWSLDTLPDHKVKLTSLTCFSDLSVSLPTGFLIEAGATIVDAWICMQIISRSRATDIGVKAAVDTVMIVYGLKLTGMYFNPSMASANTFGCVGTDWWEHLFVYWLGPFVGIILAYHINNKIRIR